MALKTSDLEEFRNGFLSEKSNLLAQNIVSRSCPLEATLSRKVLEKTNHIFTNKVDEVKPVTNQRSSGRCWLFACLNAMRIPFIKAKNLEDFEFSQSYLFFWDKIERSNYFLNSVVEVSKRTPREVPDGRLLSFLLSNPTCDGGQWDMVVNLVEKHGVMPKKCFPETHSCESSLRMNNILKSKLREFCYELISMIDNGASDADLQSKIKSQMAVIYRIVSVCLSIPPETFTWEYYDKAKKYNKVGPITPLKFYEEHVKASFDVSQKICLVSDPRPHNPYGKSYTVDCLGNVVGGKKTVYNNQPIDALAEMAANAIKKGEPVWFGCDVSKHFASKQGILDPSIHDFELVYGTGLNKVLSKANRLSYGDSEMNHAMVLTGIQVDDNDKVMKWRIENSWGEDRNEKGYITMTSEWFNEFVFEVVVDKELVSAEVLSVLDEEPTVLPAWDPMGALASENKPF